MHTNVGKCLRIAQEKKGVSNRDLCEGMGVVRQQVTRWRKSENMKLHQLQEICKILGVGLDEFCSLEQ